MHNPDLDFWRTLMLAGVALGQTCFASLYAFFPWRASFLGRALFFKAVTFAILVDVFIVARICNIPHVDVVFVILYGLLGFGVWFQFFAFLKVRRDGRRKDRRLAARNKAGLS